MRKGSIFEIIACEWAYIGACSFCRLVDGIAVWDENYFVAIWSPPAF